MELLEISQICSLYQPKTLSKSELNSNGAYLVYGANGVIGKHFEYNHEKSQVVVTCRGATCGRVNITKPKSWINGNAMVIKPLKDNILKKYLFYSLLNLDFSVAIKGAAQPQITRQSLSPLKIPLPPLEDQKRIVKILDQADSLRQKRKQAIALLDEYVKSVFLEMFGDPVSNPKGWKKVSLGQLGKLDRGVSKHRPRNAPELLGGDHPLIQTGDVSKCDFYINKYHSSYSNIGLRQSKKWPKGTLCITIAANIAKTGILGFEACFPDSVVGFIPDDDKTNNEFIHYWFSFFQKILEESAPESAQKNINLKILRELKVALPPFELQADFCRSLRKIEFIKERMLQQSQELDTQFQALMQKAFKGEL